MRKRDRLRYAKRLRALAQKFYDGVACPIEGSAWYFENDAENKGINFAHSALANAKYLIGELEILTTAMLKPSKSKR